MITLEFNDFGIAVHVLCDACQQFQFFLEILVVEDEFLTHVFEHEYEVRRGVHWVNYFHYNELLVILNQLWLLAIGHVVIDAHFQHQMIQIFCNSLAYFDTFVHFWIVVFWLLCCEEIVILG